MNIVSITRPLAYIAACGVIALGLATAPAANAVTTSGSLNGSQDGSPNVLLPTTSEGFQAIFDDGDNVGPYTFNFENTLANSMVLNIVNAAILQGGDTYFLTGGLSAEWDGVEFFSTDQGVSGVFSLERLIAPGDVVSLVFNFGEAVIASGDANPTLSFGVEASVVPLPAGFVLFLTGLAGIGFLGRYKAKRRVPELA